MKIYHFVFETLLITITIALLLSSVFGDGGYAIAVWWAILGTLQVVHALGLAFAFHKIKPIFRYIKVYLLGVVMNFLLLGVMIVGLTSRVWGENGGFRLLDIIYVITLVVVPAVLALYLWFITWHFRRKPETVQMN